MRARAKVAGARARRIACGADEVSIVRERIRWWGKEEEVVGEGQRQIEARRYTKLVLEGAVS